MCDFIASMYCSFSITLLPVSSPLSDLRFHKIKIKNKKKDPPGPPSQVWRLENEFYNFALDHFHFLRKKTLVDAEPGGRLVDRGQKFAYEKIKPKRN